MNSCIGGDVDGEDIELLDRYSSTVFDEDLTNVPVGNVCSSNTKGFNPVEVSSVPALIAPLLYSPSSAELYVEEDTDEPPESRSIGGVPYGKFTWPNGI